jgi:hypothetical protein
MRREPWPGIVPAMTFSVWRMLLGVLFGVLGHALAVGSTFVVGAIMGPSTGSGLEGLEGVVAAVATFFIIEALVAIAAIIAVIRLYINGRRDMALGIFLGWLAGPAVYLVAQLRA